MSREARPDERRRATRQAVAVWVNQLADRVAAVVSEQVASRDIDFLGGRRRLPQLRRRIAADRGRASGEAEVDIEE